MPEVIETAIIPEVGQHIGINGIDYKIVDTCYVQERGELVNIVLKLEKQCS